MKLFSRYTLSFILLIIASGIFAQTPLKEATRMAEVVPMWPGCTPEINDCSRGRLIEFIAANIQQPAEAKMKGTGGVVLVEFVIEKNGTIGETRAMNDPGLGLGTEAVRVVSLMNDKKIKWAPAINKGK